jgi:chromate transporter
LASLLTTWVAFVPCFVFIFLGAPYVERLRGNQAISSALGGITAAVVGVIANLAVYFALHTLFSTTSVHNIGWARLEVPDLDALRGVQAVIAAVAGIAVLRWRWSVPRVLALAAALGLAAGVVGLPVS